MQRREFLFATAAVGAVTSLTRPARAATTPATSVRSGRALSKGYMYGGGPRRDAKNKTAPSMGDTFKLLRAAGFAGVEVNSGMNQAEVIAARDAAGLKVHSVVIANHWTHPLSSPDAAVRETGLKGLLQGLRDARAYGADAVLLVPGVVNKDTPYDAAWERSIAAIRQAVPLATELRVAIAIENVWNKFLLSPREAAAYVDQFQSPWVKWYFDVGNVVDYGWPDQWIRILGPRIAKVHIKEFSRKIRDKEGPYAGFRTELHTGDSDWPAVMAALDAIGYRGWITSEQYRTPNLSDAEWFTRLSAQMDKIIAS
jgi:L-ribulose-5-phosphate 3-epimerase